MNEMIYMQIETPAQSVGYMLWELEEVTTKFLVELLNNGFICDTLERIQEPLKLVLSILVEKDILETVNNIKQH